MRRGRLPAYTDEQRREELLQQLQRDPSAAVGAFCHEGLETKSEQPYAWEPVTHVAYVCSMEGRGATPEEALANLVSQVRAAIEGGQFGC